MTTLAQEIQQEIKNLEESGSAEIYVNMLKQQLKDIQTQKEPKEEQWAVQAINRNQEGNSPLDLNNLPFDPATAAGQASLSITEKKTQ